MKSLRLGITNPQ